MLDKGKLFPHLPNTTADVGLNKGQIYGSVYSSGIEPEYAEGGSVANVIISAFGAGFPVPIPVIVRHGGRPGSCRFISYRDGRVNPQRRR
jgi:hypothetical protein